MSLNILQSNVSSFHAELIIENEWLQIYTNDQAIEHVNGLFCMLKYSLGIYEIRWSCFPLLEKNIENVPDF